MLYNPLWNKPQPKPGTWASVIAWLETKDPEEAYFYADRGYCLAAQYNHAVGREYKLRKAMSGNPFTYFTFDRKLERLARHGFLSAFHPLTFGAALKRAKAKL